MPARGWVAMWLSGRGVSYPTPPPQIPACSFPAPGSRRRSNAIVGLDAIDPQAHCFSDMLNPALCPEHALLLTFPSTGRLPIARSHVCIPRTLESRLPSSALVQHLDS